MAEEGKPSEDGKPKKRFSLKMPAFRSAGKKSPPAPKKKKPGKAPKDEKYLKSISDIFRDFKEKELAKERFAIMGLGNDIKGDDGLGFYVVDRLRKEFANDGNLLFVKTSVPEDHVREIRNFAPTLLVIIDAADFGKRPGSIKVIKEHQISGSFISTHTTPITLFLRLYQADQPVRSAVTIIGVQRKSSEFGQPMGGPVKKAGDTIAETISSLYRKGMLGAALESEITRASSPLGRVAGHFSMKKDKAGKDKEKPT
jgi:hydrogenase 3 maturation protease